jgi:hypothetical protein
MGLPDVGVTFSASHEAGIGLGTGQGNTQGRPDRERRGPDQHQVQPRNPGTERVDTAAPGSSEEALQHEVGSQVRLHVL